jgi:hypothetical protein
MNSDIQVILDENMPDDEREELAQLIRDTVHNEWFGQYSNTVIGPSPRSIDGEAVA